MAAPIGILGFLLCLVVARLVLSASTASWVDYGYAAPILLRTTLFAVISAGAQSLLGLAMALVVVLFARTIVQKTLLIACFFAPYAAPGVLVGLAYRFALGPNASLPLQLERNFGIPAQFWLTEHPLAAATAASVWQFSPFAFLLIYLALRTTPLRSTQAALIDGASGWKLFTKIILPPIIPVLLAVFFLRLVFMLGKFETPFIFTKQVASDSEVAAVVIAAAYGGTSVGGPATLAVALFVLSAITTGLYLSVRRIGAN